MKIALLNPPWPIPDRPEMWGVRAGSRWPHVQRRPAPGMLPRYVPFPFFLAIAAAAAKHAGHEVLLLDAVAANMDEPEFVDRVAAFGPGLIFAETSTPSLDNDLALLRQLRGRLPRAVAAAGGTHAASLAAELLNLLNTIDFWIAGEYDLSVAALANALERGDAPDAAPGLMSAKSAAAFKGPAGIADLDALPRPLYEQLPMLAYSDPVCGLPAPSAQTWLSRGCPYGCTFCVWPQVVYGNRRYRRRAQAAALDEVEFLVSTYGVESFYFDDDTTNIGEPEMLALAHAIRGRGLDRLPWAMMARADCMTPAMIEALAEAGMYSVKYGVESVSPALIDACGKQTRLDRLARAIEHTRRLGIKMHLTFTFGLPGETRQTMRETLDFALAVKPETAQFSICTPFPGTVFYEECERNGWLTTRDWRCYLGSGEPVVQTPWLGAAELKTGFEEAEAEWSAFCAERLEERRKALAGKLANAAAAGRKWTLLGDADFASFIWKAAPAAVGGAYVPEPPARDWSGMRVIVSRHDEEKLKRRLLAAPGVASDSILALYG